MALPNKITLKPGFRSSAFRARGVAGLHPLVAAAAVCLIIMSGVAVAVMTGVLPSPMAKDAPQVEASADKGAETVASRFGQVSNSRPDLPPSAEPAPAPLAVAIQRCSNCGVVQSVRAVKVEGQGTGVGAVGGGVVGGLVGNQFGGGNGRTALTLLGAAGGAFAGHEIEKNVRSTTSYQMTVRMENGTSRSFHSSTPYNWREGDPVRVVNGRVVARNANG
jgi:outer membrane lipoprotein SlyB